jgi:hypothetical protein
VANIKNAKAGSILKIASPMKKPLAYESSSYQPEYQSFNLGVGVE